MLRPGADFPPCPQLSYATDMVAYKVAKVER